jgi:hypothetical protein
VAAGSAQKALNGEICSPSQAVLTTSSKTAACPALYHQSINAWPCTLSSGFRAVVGQRACARAGSQDMARISESP